jgi:hypothetical protein
VIGLSERRTVVDLSEICIQTLTRLQPTVLPNLQVRRRFDAISAQAASASQGRKSLPIMPGCSMEPGGVDAVSERAQFADHLAGPHLL